MFNKKMLAVSLSAILMLPYGSSIAQGGAATPKFIAVEKVYADELELACKPFLPDYGMIPGLQPRIGEINGMDYFLADPALESFIRNHEDFGSYWLDGVEDDVLELAGITEFSQMNDSAEIVKYQEAWNEIKERQIVVDGKFGEQTLRTGCADNALALLVPLAVAAVAVMADNVPVSSGDTVVLADDVPPAGSVDGVPLGTAVALGVLGLVILDTLDNGSGNSNLIDPDPVDPDPVDPDPVDPDPVDPDPVDPDPVDPDPVDPDPVPGTDSEAVTTTTTTTTTTATTTTATTTTSSSGT
jgi:hypothetical protein